MKSYKFYKEYDNRWYIDLPKWEGTKEELEMVCGADTMLEYFAEGNNEVELCISEKYFDNSDKLEFIRLADKIENGAFYLLREYKDIEFNLELWLCDVTLWVFDKFPKNIYISVINQ